MIDLSAVGMRLRSVAVLQPRSEITGQLVLKDGRRITLSAVVVWTTSPENAGYAPGEVGLELSSVPDEYLTALAELFADAS